MKTLDLILAFNYFLVVVSAIIFVDKIYYTEYRKLGFIWLFCIFIIEALLFSVKILITYY